MWSFFDILLRNLNTMILSLLVIAWMTACGPGEKEPWTDAQLIAPATLAARITDSSRTTPVIIGIGPGGGIKGAIELGQSKDKENQDKLRSLLKGYSSETEVIIYCGCCPFSQCPNIRPAFRIANEMHFKNARLLDIPANLKKDWIDKGYPVVELVD